MISFLTHRKAIRKFHLRVSTPDRFLDFHSVSPKIKNHLTLLLFLFQLGVTKAFKSEQADFSGITGKKDLFISAVIQKTFINVTEDGTEAAAATVGEFGNGLMVLVYRTLYVTSCFPYLSNKVEAADVY